MASQYAFGPKEDDPILRHRLMTRVSVTRGEPPMRRLVKKLMALSAEAMKEEGEVEPGEEEEEGKEEGAEDMTSAKGVEKGMADVEKAAKSFLLELAAFELPLLKTRAVIGANRREQDNFKNMQVDLTQQIESSTEEISRLKFQLEEAQAYRRQEEECELVRHQIAQHPPRAESEAAIAALHQEIEALERENQGAARVLELRRKQFSLLLNTVDDLQALLEDNSDADLKAALGLDSASTLGNRGRVSSDKSPLRDPQGSSMQID